MKHNRTIISLIIIVIILLVACGQSNDEKIDSINFNDIIGKDENTNIPNDATDKDSNSNMQNSAKGKFIQVDITPPDIMEAEVINFTQGDNGEYLLSVYDNDMQKPRAFSYQAGVWIEKSNEKVIQMLADKNVIELKAFIDFSDNWWVFYIEDTLTKGFQISADGSSHEIELSDYTDSVGIINCLISNADTIAIDIYFEDWSQNDILVID